MARKKTDGMPHTRWPVRTLAAAVVAGPDQGRHLVAEGESMAIGSARSNDLVLSDPTVSRFHLELRRSADGVEIVDHGSTNGTWSGKVRLQRAIIAPGTVLQLGQTRLRVEEGRDAELELADQDRLAGLIGSSPAMRRLFVQLRGASQSAAPALVQGEFGSGKKLVARVLHDLGPQSEGPLVSTACGQLAPAQLGQQLFGDEEALGLLEQAEEGTLLLEEIGEMPLEVQAVLNRVLERGSFRPLASRGSRPLRARVIATASQDLRAEVNAGRFRLDLYYRLAVFLIDLPPLRDRSSDIPLLVSHFLDELGASAELDRCFPPEVLDALCRQVWPGNVLELRNLVEATVAHGAVPSPAAPARAELPADLDFIDRLCELRYRDARGRLLQEFEGRYLRQLIERADQNVSGAARLAEMDRSHLISLLRRHKLRR